MEKKTCLGKLFPIIIIDRERSSLGFERMNKPAPGSSGELRQWKVEEWDGCQQEN